MDILKYIFENALILIPALLILGYFFKTSKLFPAKFIPLILLIFGLCGAVMLLGLSADSIIQGILVSGAAVYGNQIYKQLVKKE